MPIAIGLDFGSTSLSAVAIDQNVQQLACCTEAHDANIDGLPPNHHEQNPSLLFDKAIRLLRRLTASPSVDPDSIVCLGITGQMHGILLINQELRPLTNLITWQDRRVLDPTRNETILDQITDSIGDQNSSSTGCKLRPGFGAVTLAWLQRKNQLPSEQFRCSTIMDWFASNLTQVGPDWTEVAIDRSNAASLGIFNFTSDTWDVALIEKLELQRNWLPTVKTSGESLGGIRPYLASECGLPDSTQICVPIGDHQAAILGSGGLAAGSLQINIGTGGQISWFTNQFDRVEDLETRYLPHENFMFVGAGKVGGRAFEWLATTVQSWLNSFGFSMSLDAVYRHILNSIKDDSQPHSGLICEPYFFGTRQNPNRGGGFSGISANNFHPGNIANAIINGIVQSFFETYTAVVPEQQPERIIATGNAITKIPELANRLGSKFETPVLTPKTTEPAATGAAMIAGSATGIWESLRAACEQTEFIKLI